MSRHPDDQPALARWCATVFAHAHRWAVARTDCRIWAPRRAAPRVAHLLELDAPVALGLVVLPADPRILLLLRRLLLTCGGPTCRHQVRQRGRHRGHVTGRLQTGKPATHRAPASSESRLATAHEIRRALSEPTTRPHLRPPTEPRRLATLGALASISACVFSMDSRLPSSTAMRSRTSSVSSCNEEGTGSVGRPAREEAREEALGVWGGGLRFALLALGLLELLATESALLDEVPRGTDRLGEHIAHRAPQLREHLLPQLVQRQRHVLDRRLHRRLVLLLEHVAHAPRQLRAGEERVSYLRSTSSGGQAHCRNRRARPAGSGHATESGRGARLLPRRLQLPLDTATEPRQRGDEHARPALCCT